MLETLVEGINMTEINPIGSSTQIVTPIKTNTNFKAGGYTATPSDYDTFVKEQEKAKKNAKKKEMFYYGFLGTMTLATLVGLGYTIWGSKFLGKSDKALKHMMERDLSKSKNFKELSYNDEITNFVKSWKKSIENPKALQNVGASPMKTALLYGPPGTGKTTFVEAITKEFPDAKLFDVNVTQMGSEYQSVGERNFKKAIDIICDYADKNPKKKVVVLLDEIDSVMMVDNSLNAKTSNNMLNEFKKAFTEKLKTRDNIFTFGATNLEVNSEKALLLGGKQLDSAMLDRFDKKVLVGLPNSKQLANTIAEIYKNAPNVPAALKSADSKEVMTIANFLEKHGASFRKLDSIKDDAGNKALAESGQLTLRNITNTIKEMKEELNFTDAEFKKLLSDLNVSV